MDKSSLIGSDGKMWQEDSCIIILCFLSVFPMSFAPFKQAIGSNQERFGIRVSGIYNQKPKLIKNRASHNC